LHLGAHDRTVQRETMKTYDHQAPEEGRQPSVRFKGKALASLY
jgi:hypothetical protein